MCRSEAAVEQMLKEVHDHHQRPLQIFVNSAGIVGGTNPLKADP
jgi:NAD(P)-dependent dehydrogenase (short-subunit alcohol dehydrogenase family)